MSKQKIVAAYKNIDEITEDNIPEIADDIMLMLPAFIGKPVSIRIKEDRDFVIHSPSLGDNIAYNLYREFYGEPEKDNPIQEEAKGRCIDMAEAIMEFIAEAEVCGFCAGQGVILMEGTTEHRCSLCSGTGRYIKYEDVVIQSSEEEILPF